MTDDTSGESPFSVDALLDGDDVRDDAIGELLAALKGAPVPAELAGESAAVAAIAAAIPATTAVTATSSGIRRLTTRTGALAAVGALAFTGVAAAASGVPVPVVEELFKNDDAPTLVEEIVEDDLPGSETDDGSTEPAVKAGAEDDGAAEADAEPADTKDANHGDDVSDAAQSDCGKPAKAGPKEEEAGADDVESEAVESTDPAVSGDEECDANNHGEHVSEAAKDKADRDKANNGNANNGNANTDKAKNDKAESEEADHAGPGSGDQNANANGSPNSGQGNANGNAGNGSNGNGNANGGGD